jgi:spore coat polysaccharide biosynthesis protein SpsF
MSERVVASIEARMRSSRLPNKVLLDVAGAPSLTRLLRRLRRARLIDAIVLATTTSAADDVLAEWAQSEGVALFRGSEDDVLARVVGAHAKMQSDVIVEICGDCPLIDPEIVDLSIETFFLNDVDVVSTACRQSFPQGVDSQVFRFRALKEIERAVTDPAVREHVSLYFYEHPEKYRTIHLASPLRRRRPMQRLQLDYPEDIALIRAVYERLLPKHGDNFGLDEIVELLDREPGIVALNAHCRERAAR